MSANHNAVTTVAGSAPISNSAYTQLWSGASLVTTTQIVISNSTDQNITIASGASGSEVDFFTVAKGCQDRYVCQPSQFPVGTRFAIIAQGAASSSGYLTVTLA